MTLWATIQIAGSALRQNKLRSVLAMLGIIIGVGAVIAVVAVASGAKQAVEEQIASLGSNLLIINPGSSRFGGRRGGAGTSKPFVDGDVLALRNEIPEIEYVSGMVSGGAPAVAANKNWTTSVRGIDPDYVDARKWVVEEGRNFTMQEVQSKAKLAVVGQTIINELFDGNSPIGQRIRVRNVPFTVIGVLKGKGKSSWGSDQDDIIFMPISTARARVVGRGGAKTDQVRTIYATISDSDDVDYVEERIAEILRLRRELKPGAKDDFNIANITEFVEARNEATKTLGFLLAATAAISLVVGGIGIMNIMLVSVTERTREIGLRMAVGARGTDILTQFLVEAIVMCLIGGILGLGVGFGAAQAFAHFGDMAVLIDPSFVLIAVISSAAVGVFFGFYPARRASHLSPIDALRYE